MMKSMLGEDGGRWRKEGGIFRGMLFVWNPGKSWTCA